MIEASFETGKVDEMLQWIGQPGFHSLGTEQRGEFRARYGPGGLEEARQSFAVRDRWDNYRPMTKADRFERNVTASMTVGPAK